MYIFIYKKGPEIPKIYNSKTLKLPKICLATYNFQNTAISNYHQKVTTLKKQQYRGITKINYSRNSTHITQKKIYKE